MGEGVEGWSGIKGFAGTCHRTKLKKLNKLIAAIFLEGEVGGSVCQNSGNKYSNQEQVLALPT